MRVHPMEKLLLIAIRTVMVAGAALVVSLPWTSAWLLGFFHDPFADDATYRIVIVVFFMVVGVLVLWGLGEAQAMVASISSGPFTARNARALTRAGILSLAVAALFVIRVILYPDATSILVAVAAVLVGLACFTLAQLIARAAEIKAENDLTI